METLGPEEHHWTQPDFCKQLAAIFLVLIQDGVLVHLLHVVSELSQNTCGGSVSVWNRSQFTVISRL